MLKYEELDRRYQRLSVENTRRARRIDTARLMNGRKVERN